VDLSTGHDVDSERDIMSLEIGLHGLAIAVKNDLVGDKEASVPLLVDFGKMLVLGVEDVVNKFEACEPGTVVSAQTREWKHE
jgi:hypothetical protein